MPLSARCIRISDNSPVKAKLFDSNIIQNENAIHSDVFKCTLLRRTSPKVNCLHPTYQGTKCARRALATWFITSFHTAPLPMVNGKNVNVMLERCFYNVRVGKKSLRN